MVSRYFCAKNLKEKNCGNIKECKEKYDKLLLKGIFLNRNPPFQCKPLCYYGMPHKYFCCKKDFNFISRQKTENIP